MNREQHANPSPIGFEEVFSAEKAAIPEVAGGTPDEHRQLSGLAFSGGGIRSATFNLGIIQALSELKLLRHFDYLSTVSGGGYIGGWLSAFIHRQAEGEAATAEDKLHSGGNEDDAVRFLRSYSNYLTPQIGLFSADTLTAVATYIRNLYLNLSVLLLYLAALLLLPRLLVWGVDWIGGEGGDLERSLFLLSLGGIFLTIALVFVGLNVGRGIRKDEATPIYARQGFILLTVVLPVVLAAWLVSYGLYVGSSYFADAPLSTWLVWGIATYFIPWSIGWIAGRLLAHNDAKRARFTFLQIIWMVIYALLAAMFGGWLLSLFARYIALAHPLGYSGYWVVAALGAVLMLKIYSLTVVAHIGLMGREFSHESREWWSRVGGWMLMCAMVWAGLFGIVFLAPIFFKWAHAWLLGSGAGVWAGATLSGVLLGRSPNTSFHISKNLRNRIAAITPYIFIIGLLGLVSWVLNEILTHFSCVDCVAATVGADAKFPEVWSAVADQFQQVPLHTLALLTVACAVAATLLAMRIDVNLFSIYFFYRQRLVRCYLGATRCKQRRPHPFTGFDPDDDLRLAEFCRVENGKQVCQRPYPILNTAMNIVHGKQLAWQERRAASFAFTPMYTGYDFRQPDAAGERASYFRPTAEYQSGVHLGSAIAISGAAASPNMGYHSSPALTFLMTVFNVRLGHWSGNPANPSTWRRPGPRAGGQYLLKELFGLTDSESPYVYLSDGGHFENLAIYELVRRRCRNILVVDAGEDKNRTFDDLGSAIRKCYADFGVVIDIRVDRLKSRKNGRVGSYFALGDIHYPDAPSGILLYIKPGLTGSEPADLLNYARTHPEFPHQPTTDQWFDESQFESYRKLGHWIGKCVLESALATATNRRKESSQESPDASPLIQWLFEVMHERIEQSA